MLLRQVVAVVALVAFLGGTAGVQPCQDDEECAMSCSLAASLACPASGEHSDPVAPVHSCDCMCHVPGVVRIGPPVTCTSAPVAWLGAVPIGAPLSLGFIEPPFHPPRA